CGDLNKGMRSRPPPPPCPPPTRGEGTAGERLRYSLLWGGGNAAYPSSMHDVPHLNGEAVHSVPSPPMAHHAWQASRLASRPPRSTPGSAPQRGPGTRLPSGARSATRGWCAADPGPKYPGIRQKARQGYLDPGSRYARPG